MTGLGVGGGGVDAIKGQHRGNKSNGGVGRGGGEEKQDKHGA